MLTSEGFIAAGKNRALGYFLADSGYDVWLGNDRGSFHFVEHQIYNKTNDLFWNYSMDDIGLFDYKAMLDYILWVTGQPQIDFIGHSQGGCAMAILLSSYPQYNRRIRQAHLISPAVFVFDSPTVKNLMPIYNVSKGIFSGSFVKNRFHFPEFIPFAWIPSISPDSFFSEDIWQ